MFSHWKTQSYLTTKGEMGEGNWNLHTSALRGRETWRHQSRCSLAATLEGSCLNSTVTPHSSLHLYNTWHCLLGKVWLPQFPNEGVHMIREQQLSEGTPAITTSCDSHNSVTDKAERTIPTLQTVTDTWGHSEFVLGDRDSREPPWYLLWYPPHSWHTMLIRPLGLSWITATRWLAIRVHAEALQLENRVGDRNARISFLVR